MDYRFIISQLSLHVNVFEELFSGIPDELIRWRNGNGKWNLLEIICHLYDEEREDFRARLKHVLENPDTTIKPIDPQEWVAERNYAGRDFDEMKINFIKERRESVNWLLSINEPQLENKVNHPTLVDLSGNLFLSNWLAHDYLHIRQVVKLKYDFLSFATGTTLEYAGTW